jgi:hypothetical protein
LDDDPIPLACKKEYVDSAEKLTAMSENDIDAMSFVTEEEEDKGKKV